MRSIFLLVLCMLMVVNSAIAFEDSVQRYDVDFEEIWTESGIGSGSVTQVNVPSTYPSSNGLLFSTGYDAGNWRGVQGISAINTDYFAFTLQKTIQLGATTDIKLYVAYYNVSDSSLYDTAIISSTQLGMTSLGTYYPNSRYELVKSGNDIILYIDNVESGNVATVPATTAYVKISFGYGTYGNGNGKHIVLDDFSISSIIGMNHDWTQANTNIDASYGVQSMASFPSADYSIQTSRIISGAVINTTQLGSGTSGDPAGFVRWNRNDIFGDYFGLYQSRILRDSTVLASTKFSIFDSTVTGSVDWVDDAYATGATAAVNYDLGSPDFASYYYYLNIISSGGTGFSQNLITISGTELLTLIDYPVGDCYAVISRTSKSTGVSSDIAYGLMTITAAGDGPVDSISIPYTEYERGDTVDVTYSHEESGYIVIHDVRSSGNYYVSDGFIGSGSNMTYSFEIDDLDPFGFYYVVLKNSDNDIKDNTGYTLVETTSPYNNSISVDAAEYYYDGIVNATYSHSQSGYIAVQHVQSNEVYHISNSFDGDGDNETWLFNIAGTDPLGLYNVYLLNDEDFAKAVTSYTVTPAAMSSTWLNVIEDNVILYEDVHIAYKAVNSSTLTIIDPDGYEVYNQTVQSNVIRYVYHTVINGTGTYDVELDGDTLESDSFFVYLLDDPEGDDPDIDYGDVIDEDALEDDETMTEYYNEKFRDFAPTIWGFFMLMCLLFLMSILTSFNSGGKR